MNNYYQKIKETIKEVLGKPLFKRVRKYLKDPLFLRHWEIDYYGHRRDDNQLSVRAGYHGGKRYHYNGAGSDFARHISTGIMPFSHMSGQREKYPAKVEPESPEKAELIAKGVSNRGYRTHLESSLYHFVQTTSHTLFMYGIELFEVVYAKDEAGNTTSFHFEHLDEKYMFRFFGNYYQIIPWWVAKQSHARVQIIKIPAEKILRIEFPKRLGGRRRLQRILKRLWKLSLELIPQFQMAAMEANTNVGFDLEKFKKGEYLESAKITNAFGWNQGRSSANYVTEYYWFLRYLREAKAQAIVRSEIFDRLNDCLNGPVLNLGVNVSIENLPTEESINQQEQLMKAGDMKFKDIYDAAGI